MENCYRELPEGYREARVVDAKEKKTSIIFTLSSFILTAAVLLPVLLTFGSLKALFEEYGRKTMLLADLVFVVCMLSYIVLHELLHGAAYKALTHQKLTFGITLTVAFCGVPDIHVSRKTALIALLTPFVTFSVILIPLTIWFYSFNKLYFLLSGVLFAIHFGGCIGDLYMTALLLFRYKDPRTLVNDTGPRQTIYLTE